MKKWWLLTSAIFAEVTGTMSLRGAVDNPAWVPVAVVGYVGAILLLGSLLRAGLPVGLAYGIWSSVGVALTAILGWALFGEALSLTGIFGIGLIMLGVLVIETGTESHYPATVPIPVVSEERP
ncbi:QacE family quaternary ammonium compound efflux SMR transporter [Kocuria koreensis]|jgi:small multidrug resistance pump|uniref:QacE family quaternary ammonium compound efflux SMR transporter n=1 Tax=Rothia koreensis TaxID=592378 RepID=A0A7K1LHH4_9MICC|nr:SMR family transporter [Rothia koreensis]MUN54402.1 QacE family quaternary ammonium compound efflux SMR transporter [Rothia koreensis]